MDAPRFDRIARSISERLTRRTGLGMLAGASIPLLSLAEPSDAKQKKKITLCSNGQTVKATKKKAKKLLQQGATRGACPDRCPSGQKACGSSCIPAGDCCVDNDCSGTDFCQNGDCIALRCGNGGPCTVFATADAFTGAAVGGLSGGDFTCQAAAILAGLPGTYKAWLSAGSATPETRFTNLANAGPYRLVANNTDNGNSPPLVATAFTDLLTCDGGTCLQSPINRDENGVEPTSGSAVWTGTLSNGNSADETCGGWTSPDFDGRFGNLASDTTNWTDAGIASCVGGSARIYCFQQAT